MAKRITSVLIVFLLVFSMFSCSSDRSYRNILLRQFNLIEYGMTGAQIQELLIDNFEKPNSLVIGGTASSTLGPHRIRYYIIFEVFCPERDERNTTWRRFASITVFYNNSSAYRREIHFYNWPRNSCPCVLIYYYLRDV